MHLKQHTTVFQSWIKTNNYAPVVYKYALVRALMLLVFQLIDQLFIS